MTALTLSTGDNDDVDAQVDHLLSNADQALTEAAQTARTDTAEDAHCAPGQGRPGHQSSRRDGRGIQGRPGHQCKQARWSSRPGSSRPSLKLTRWLSRPVSTRPSIKLTRCIGEARVDQAINKAGEKVQGGQASISRELNDRKGKRLKGRQDSQNEPETCQEVAGRYVSKWMTQLAKTMDSIIQTNIY